MTDKTNILFPKLSYELMGAAFEVRNSLGAGQKELVYQNALEEQFQIRGIPFEKEVQINILSEKSGKKLGNYRLDFVVDGKICIELKAIKFTPIKIEQQLYGYLKSTTYELGYLINFGSSKLYWKRIILTNDRKPLLKYLSNS